MASYADQESDGEETGTVDEDVNDIDTWDNDTRGQLLDIFLD